jgi:hypothetical protein
LPLVTLKWPEKTYIDQRIFNRPVLTSFNRFSPVLTAGPVNTHIDHFFANPDFKRCNVFFLHFNSHQYLFIYKVLNYSTSITWYFQDNTMIIMSILRVVQLFQQLIHIFMNHPIARTWNVHWKLYNFEYFYHISYI